MGTDMLYGTVEGVLASGSPGDSGHGCDIWHGRGHARVFPAGKNMTYLARVCGLARSRVCSPLELQCFNGRGVRSSTARAINFWHGRAEWHGLGVQGSGSLENSARAVLSSTLEKGLLARPCAIARAGRARLWKFECNCSTGVHIGTIRVCIFPSGTGVRLSTG
ncbi:hypothetical protein JCGZ_00512 [Jatropha curcas]|uniref:Uncharacterized protein n=1 Tax=Jatropha curcas TaxID=180498 RepID=A0A067JGQ5_JATCU|nr:hypothetical protein JCGZ_00512 [Jatropha curcas]